jgi:hypothetical protein
MVKLSPRQFSVGVGAATQGQQAILSPFFLEAGGHNLLWASTSTGQGSMAKVCRSPRLIVLASEIHSQSSSRVNGKSLPLGVPST